MSEHIRWTRNRREFVTDAFCGFGSLAVAQMVAQAAAKNPLAPKTPHMPDKAKAKSVIFLFQAGGPSHIETFNPKTLVFLLCILVKTVVSGLLFPTSKSLAFYTN